MHGRRSQQATSRVFRSSEISFRGTSPACSTLSDCDADDEGNMSTGDRASRSLSVHIPAQQPFIPTRPTLANILSNTAPPPWTLTAFMAYLSQNHCLETLEFTMDASRYRKHFDQMEPQGTVNAAAGCEYVKMLWQRLLDAYIIPDGPREVNLPSEVRDRLLSLPNRFVPPSPDSLDPAVKIIYDLMDESVLVPFLNSVSEYRGTQSTTNSARNSDDEMGSQDDVSSSRRPRSRRSRRGSSPLSTGGLTTSSYGSTSGGQRTRTSRTSNLVNLGNRQSTTSVQRSHQSCGSGDNLTDDSGGASSPGHEPMTPPTTPPTSDAGGMSPGASPRSRTETRGDAWKKMTGKLGFKKTTSRTSLSGYRDSLYRSRPSSGVDQDGAGGLL
jgi:hypothetical protein